MSRKVPGGGNHSSSDIDDSDAELEDEDDERENTITSPSKLQSLSPASNTCNHNGINHPIAQLPLMKTGTDNNNSLTHRSPTNDLYGAKLT